MASLRTLSSPFIKNVHDECSSTALEIQQEKDLLHGYFHRNFEESHVLKYLSALLGANFTLAVEDTTRDAFLFKVKLYLVKLFRLTKFKNKKNIGIFQTGKKDNIAMLSEMIVE